MEKELFETIKEMVGCEYISDLRYGKSNKAAQQVLKNINLNKYTVSDLTAAAKYILGESIETTVKDEIIEFLQPESIE